MMSKKVLSKPTKRANGKHRTRYIAGSLSISSINILIQPREKFENIEFLADNIADKGLLNPLAIAVFTAKQTRLYLKTLNELWGTSYHLGDLISKLKNGEKIYYILLAGERRFRACKMIYSEGCNDCREKYGQEKPGVCFRRHGFVGDKVRVSFCVNIDPLDALELQLAENTHMPVSSEREAEVYTRLFKLERKRLEKKMIQISLVKFARGVGRSSSTIANAIHYCELPARVKKMVEDGHIKYGAALLLWRLRRDAKIEDEEELELWALRSARKKINEFREMVEQKINEVKSGQMNLSGMFGNNEINDPAVRRRKVVAHDMIFALCQVEVYLQEIPRYYIEGLIGLPDSPFAEGSVLRHLDRQITLLENLLPYMRATLANKAKIIIEEGDKVTAALSELVVNNCH